MCTCWGKQRQWGKASSSINSSEPFPSRSQARAPFPVVQEALKKATPPTACRVNTAWDKATQAQGEWSEGKPINSQGFMKMCDGEIEWFHIQFKCLRSDGALKISATKHSDGFADCRTPSRGCSCTFPLWAADWSRKQPDRKSTGVFTPAAGSRVLRQSTLSCWKLKCDLTFNSNMNTFLSFFLSKRIQLLTIRTKENVHLRWQTQLHLMKERDWFDWQRWFRNTQDWGVNSPTTPDNHSNAGFFWFFLSGGHADI